MKKIALASDFDNTLHFRDGANGYIKDCDRIAVTQFRKNGGLFGTCSGRPISSLLLETRDNIDLDFHIVSTGALVCENDEDLTVIHQELVSADTTYDIIQNYRSEVDFYIHADNGVYVFEQLKYSYPTQEFLSGKEDLDTKAITGMSGRTASPEDSLRIVEILNQRYPEISAYQNGEWMDIVANGVSKGSGLLKLKEAKQIDVIGAIGDARNDLASLEEADVSFTFPYAPKDVQEKADYIVNSVAEALQIMESMK